MPARYTSTRRGRRTTHSAPTISATFCRSPARTNDNSANFGSSDLGAIGFINPRYEPWNGNPAGSSSSPTITDPKVKDPVLLSITHPFGRSDDWDFPTNLTQALGRV